MSEAVPDPTETSPSTAIVDRRDRGPVALAFAAGLLLAVQSRINGQLGHVTGDGILAAAMTLSVGLVTLLVIAVLRPSTRIRLIKNLPTECRAGRLRWWHLIGGIGGAMVVASQALTVPVLGVALYAVLMVAGTTSASLGVDRAGLGPGGVRPITAPRVIGAVATTLAVALAISGRLSAANFAWAAAALVLVAGLSSTLQQAVNAMVAQRTGDPLVAGVVNFVGGAAALLLAYLAEHLLGGRAWVFPPAPWSQPILWLGGPFGVIFIVTAAFAVRTLGVLLFSLLSIAGQLVGSLVSDLAVPTPGTQVGWQLVAGIVLTGVAVTYAALASRSATF